MPRLVPQPHGGALLSGGVPGNKSGPGRTPSALRALLRQVVIDKKVGEILGQVVAGELGDEVTTLKGDVIGTRASAADRTRAAEVLLRYAVGLPGKVDAGEVRGRLEATVDLAIRLLPLDVRRPFLAGLVEIWGPKTEEAA